MKKKKKSPSLLSSGFSLPLSVITSSLEFIPSICQERIKSGVHSLANCLSEKDRIIQNSLSVTLPFWTHFGLWNSSYIPQLINYFDFLILNSHAIVFYAETLQQIRNNCTYAQRGLGNISPSITGKELFACQPKCE